MAPDTNADQAPSALVQQMCAEELEPLTKVGAISAGFTNLGWDAVALVGGVIGSIVLFTSDMTYEQMGKSLGATFGWLGLLFIPLLPAMPFVAVAVALGGVGAILYGTVRASAAKAAGTFDFSCPKCSRTFDFTRSRRKFEIVCPDCHSFIRVGSAPSVDAHCTYGGLKFFGWAETPFQCPGCKYKEGVGQADCAQCKKPIPKGVLFCRECETWLGVPEADLGSFTTTTQHYDVGRFSPATCRAYVSEMEKRIAPFADQLAALGAAGSIPMNAFGSTVVEIESALHLLNKCALAAQWLLAKNDRLPTDLVNRLAAYSLRIQEALEKLRASNSLREKQEQQFWPIVAEARRTFTTADAVAGLPFDA